MTCRTCKHRLDVTLWGCWLATGCRIGLVLRDESAKKRNDGRHPEFSEQYARAREAACSGNIPRVRARLVSAARRSKTQQTRTHTRARLVSIQVSMKSVFASPCWLPGRLPLKSAMLGGACGCGLHCYRFGPRDKGAAFTGS